MESLSPAVPEISMNENLRNDVYARNMVFFRLIYRPPPFAGGAPPARPLLSRRTLQ